MQDTEIKSLRRQLETQKNDLKSYYQKQLEDAVLAKLQEFQVLFVYSFIIKQKNN